MHDFDNNADSPKRRIEIIKAALPYMGQQMQKPLKVLIQAEELFDCLYEDDSAELSACGLNTGSIDVEAMLLGIRDFCSSKEKENINQILNMIQAYKIFQKYNEFMASRTDFDVHKEGGESNIMMDFLMSQLPEDQKGNFENIRMMMSVMNMS